MIKVNVTNQKPADLSPIYKDAINQPFDPIKLIQEVLINPVKEPLIVNQPVQISINKNSVTDDDIINLWLDCCQDATNTQSEDIIKALYSKLLINYTKPSMLNANRLFANLAGNIAKLPEPSASVVYNPSVDVIPTARKFLAGQSSYEELFAVLAYYANPTTLGFYFANETSFNDFKLYFANEVNNLMNSLPAITIQLCADFQNVTLNDLTESLLLRDDNQNNNDEFSFPRLLVNRLMDYVNHVSSAEFGILPFDIGELICPKAIVFVNIDKHAKATNRQVADEWKLINSSVQSKPPIVSLNKLSKLTTMQRQMQKINANAVQALSQKGLGVTRAKNIAFRKNEPTSMDIARLIRKIMDKMAFVNKSMNSYKKVKSSFAKPNRRDPDNFNKMGKIVSTKYKPDIHLYIDTSGSISERNYQDAVKACILMAKKLNVNLYFNSFSHVLSQCAKLNTKDKSVSAIYREFKKIPKVTGGTEYSNVWDYIMRDKSRRKEISILMTDFEYYAPNRHIDHPKNLYYAPMSHMDWDMLVDSTKGFVKSIISQVPDIRNHILF